MFVTIKFESNAVIDVDACVIDFQSSALELPSAVRSRGPVALCEALPANMFRTVLPRVACCTTAQWSTVAMAWRSEAADDHSRVLACFAGADHGPRAAAFTVQMEDKIWQGPPPGRATAKRSPQRLLSSGTRAACACCTS